LWESSIAQHESIVRSVYTTIADLSQDLSVELLNVMFKLIEALKFDNYSNYTLQFIKDFTLNAIANRESESEGKDDLSYEEKLGMAWIFFGN
jgi:hypothetical protein